MNANPDVWDSAENSLAEMISDQVKKMPDQPKIVLAAFNWNMKKSQEFIVAMEKFNQSVLKIFGITYVTAPADVCFLGFDGDSSDVGLCEFLLTTSQMPIDEIIVYSSGVPKLRIAPTKVMPSSFDQFGL
jgi:hypothetical protein